MDSAEACVSLEHVKAKFKLTLSKYDQQIREQLSE